MARFALISAVIGALALAGCSQSAVNLLNTGSITSTKKQGPAAPKVVTPPDRALHVAATSARAQKCGYYFDPEKLKTDYLTFETSNGLKPEDVAGVAKLYDFTQKRIAAKIAPVESYCSSTQTKTIKAQLTKYLAGDYAPPVVNKTAEVSNWWESDVPQGKERINPRWYEKGEKAIITTPE
ncbi:MAG: hypothetical protein AAGC70_02300 [Pseudomonadota bacterium]